MIQLSTLHNALQQILSPASHPGGIRSAILVSLSGELISSASHQRSKDDLHQLAALAHGSWRESWKEFTPGAPSKIPIDSDLGRTFIVPVEDSEVPQTWTEENQPTMLICLNAKDSSEDWEEFEERGSALGDFFFQTLNKHREHLIQKPEVPPTKPTITLK